MTRFLRAVIPIALLAGTWSLQSGSEGEPRDLVLLPFLPDVVRAAVPIDAQVLVCNARTSERVEAVALRLWAGGNLLVEQPLGVELPPDPEYLRANALIERLPRELTELHRDRRYFAGPDEPPFTPAEVRARYLEVEGLVDALQARYAADPASSPFVQPTFVLPLDLLFAPGDPAGAVANVVVEVDYELEGELRTASIDARIAWKGARVGLPEHLLAAGMSVHAGDLHVHSCHGEATGACAPSGNCAAESVQTSGSFSYAALKTQFQALGLDWFAATDHSYCINNTAEFTAIQGEIGALNSASFVAFPDIEVSSEEQGSQTGSDLGNLLCLFGDAQNHLGAHGITTRIDGGSDGTLGFCNGLDPFPSDVAAVRAQGGFPIAHHPTASSFGWNSFAAAQGIEANGLHGVEVWNGAFVSGQGGDVGRWVAWLLGGRVLYAYSGSDTHDAAFDFGANHAVLLAGETFGPASVRGALVAGRVYVSNGPALLVEADVGGATVFMGTRQKIPTQTLPAPVTVRAHYDFGADTGSVTVFRGRAGDGAESSIGQMSGLTGSGFVEFADTLSGPQRRWYRAYAQNNAGNETAYANPVFFEFQDALVASVPSVSLAAGGVEAFALTAGPAQGADIYWMLGSVTGTSPGFDVEGFHVPLVPDPYFNLTLRPFNGLFQNFLGLFAADGTGSAAFPIPAGSDPELAGLVLFHAFIAVEPTGGVTFASNPVAFTLQP